MTDSTLASLVLLALALAVAALVVALSAQRQQVARRRRTASSDLPTDVAGLRAEVAALVDQSRLALHRPELLRYDAFGDMGGRLSWSLALVDDAGTGVVLTSIHGRSDARSYAKGLVAWESDQPLSPEEDAVVSSARARSRGEAPAPTPARPRAKVGRRSDPEADAAIVEQVEGEVAVRESRDGEGAQTA
ncbi:DUF4446 family protein [Nocardioides marmoribigeumensis]|uniref:DUF4446 family protein n=1 Tax=Nocardioides marmoribigeumensis TaxID=433649 RepID=A0ABU2BVC1_9ACTN|nr:DUF4446 family protein [Nocardioides marmoribigeumensis]MDR7362211.1 hypothetical protein [Nocardioides marmoribigeumensis]